MQYRVISSKPAYCLHILHICLHISLHILDIDLFAASASDADPLFRAMLAQESAVPRLSADSNRSASETVLQFGSSEKAFMTHHDARPPRAVPDSRQDPRPNYRKPVPQDSRNNVCPDSRPPSWERPRQDPLPDRVRRSFPDRPAASPPRRNDDNSIHEIERLQQQMQSLVAQLSNEHARKNSPSTRSANMASDDPVEQFAVPSAAAYTATLQSDEDDDKYNLLASAQSTKVLRGLGGADKSN